MREKFSTSRKKKKKNPRKNEHSKIRGFFLLLFGKRKKKCRKKNKNFCIWYDNIPSFGTNRLQLSTSFGSTFSRGCFLINSTRYNHFSLALFLYIYFSFNDAWKLSPSFQVETLITLIERKFLHCVSSFIATVFSSGFFLFFLSFFFLCRLFYSFFKHLNSQFFISIIFHW